MSGTISRAAFERVRDNRDDLARQLEFVLEALRILDGAYTRATGEQYPWVSDRVPRLIREAQPTGGVAMTTSQRLRKQIDALTMEVTACEAEKAILLNQAQRDQEMILELQSRIAALELQKPGGPSRYYSDASPFNKPIVPGLLDPNSENIVGRLNASGPPARFSVGANALSAVTKPLDWTHPIYFATLDDPLVRIASSGWKNPDIEGAWIRVPAYAVPAGGNDASMAVVQPPDENGNVWEYDFWQAKPPGSSILPCNFGRRGLFNGDGLGQVAPDRGGITAARFSNALGVIRFNELVGRGEIPHALFMSVNGWHGRVWPSVLKGGTTGEVLDADAPAMGQKFRLDISDAELGPFPAWKQALLRAMRKYGMYVGDNGSAPWALQLESGTQYLAQGKADPWVAWAKSLGIAPDVNGIYKVDFSAGVDWSRLRVLA